MTIINKLKQKMEQIRDATEHAVASALPNKVSTEVQEYRYGICKGCDKLYRPTDTCKMCGCFMQVKTWIPNESCPLKKWPEAPKAN